MMVWNTLKRGYGVYIALFSVVILCAAPYLLQSINAAEKQETPSTSIWEKVPLRSVKPAEKPKQTFIDTFFNCMLDAKDVESHVYDGTTIVDVPVKIYDFEENGQAHVMTTAKEIWPGILLRNDGIYALFDIRLAGIDTPERRLRKKLPDGTPRTEEDRERERNLAFQARTLLMTQLQASGYWFQIRNPHLGKYAGKLVCEVWVNGQDVSRRMISSGLARPYEGGKRIPW